MKKAVWAALALGIVGVVGACSPAPTDTASVAPSVAPPATPVRAIVQVSGDVYRFQNNGHFGVFMVTPEGVILADPINLDTANWVKGEIAARFNGAKVVQVLYSHADWDHASGARAFEGAKVVSRVETFKEIEPPADPAARETFLKQFADVAPPTDTYNTPVNKITLGGKIVEMHHVRANHATDMSYIYFPAEKVLFVVDALAIKRLPFRNLPNYDEKDAFALVDKAASFDTAFIVGGHGEIGTKAELPEVKQYLVDLRQGVQAGIDKGQTVDQIKAELMLDKYASWGSYADFRPLNIDGMYAYLTKK